MNFDMQQPLLVSGARLLNGIDPGIVWATALLFALAYSVRSARRQNLDPRAMYWAGVCALIAGLYGSRLLTMVTSGEPLSLLAFVQIWEGGKSNYGGLLAGASAGGIYLRLRKLPLLSYADAVVPGVALGSAIGRIGCFLNGDDFGTLSGLPWAVSFPAGTEAWADHVTRGWLSPADAYSLPVHPTQLYASLLALLILLVLSAIPSTHIGHRLCAFLMMWGVARFFLEYVRGDFRALLGPLSLAQLFSIGFVLAGIALWLPLSRKAAGDLVSPKHAMACSGPGG